MSHIVEVLNVSKSYKQQSVLKGLNFSVKAGDIVGLLGENGVGKSTLIESLMNLRCADHGEIKLWGYNWQQLPQDKRERIGFVAQFSSGYQWMKVGQYLDYISHYFSNWDDVYCDQLLQKWQLDEKQYIDTLSGGQRQILDVIQALSIRPELLILDEPVAHLDPNMRRQFLTEIVELCCEQNTTVIFSTHIVSDLERVANKVAILTAGNITHYYDLDELKTNISKVTALAVEEPATLDCLALENMTLLNNVATAYVLKPRSKSIHAIATENGISLTTQPLSLEDWYLKVVHNAN